MTAEQLCLSVLTDRDASGYDIKQYYTHGEGALFATASFGSIYPALARLEQRNEVSQLVERDSVRPSRKVYRITDIGRNALAQSLRRSSPEDIYASPFAFLIKHSDLISPDEMRRHLLARREFLGRQLQFMDKIINRNSSTPVGRSTAALQRTVLIAMMDWLPVDSRT